MVKQERATLRNQLNPKDLNSLAPEEKMWQQAYQDNSVIPAADEAAMDLNE